MGDEEGGGGGDFAASPLCAWFEERVRTSFPGIKPAAFKKKWGTDAESMEVLENFCSAGSDPAAITFQDTLACTAGPPPKLAMGAKAITFVRVGSDEDMSKPLAVDDEENPIDKAVVFMDLTADSLTHLELAVQEVYLPVLTNPANQEGWGEVASKEIMDRLHAFLASVSITIGHTVGKTCLPLPPMDATDDAAAEAMPISATGDSGADAALEVNTKDKIHLLEGAVITWTKQIKNVLKADPEGLLKQGLHPTPDVEIAFWKSKATNLNSIFEQLQGERIRRVLKFLDRYKSTYCTPFANLCKSVFEARLEANDNVKYLRTLEKWFDSLNSLDEFPELVDLFKPMMHILLLIWKNSKYYNTASRLVVLIREICNALINQACSYTSGKQIFDLIADENAGQAVDQLKTTLHVCGAFKSTYFDYKATANAECPSNPWRIQSNALFMRLDSFLERCHDILDLTQTIVQFSKLAKIEIGGTKGKTLTDSVAQIYQDFESAVEAFKTVPYDIMDVGVKAFDDDYYDFRCRIKELERRLGSVLTQGFDDCATIDARFKLLDSFEGLLERPTIRDELEKKHISLVQAYGIDLKSVQELFLTERESPPIAHNLPPIAGALTWCRGLKERITQPMTKLKELNNSIMQREEAKEVVKVNTTIMSSLEDYEHQKIEEWGSDVERSSQAKLRLPLLARSADARLADTPERSLLRVNFDPALVRLLREVKYFLLLGLNVPDSALDIYKKAETYRRQTGKLDLIVNKYNKIMLELLPVEAPLLAKQLSKIDATMQTGIKDIDWKNPAIDDFITKCEGFVSEAFNVLYQLKDNLIEVEDIMNKWSSEPLLTRKAKPVNHDEFEQSFKAKKKAMYNDVKKGGIAIEKKLKQSHAVLKVPKTHADWRAYVDFVSNIVVDGLSKVVLTSLEFLGDQVNFESIEREGKLPMLKVSMNLVKDAVTFQPQIFETGDPTAPGLRDIVNGWITSFYHVADIFPRLDDPDGRYVKEMASNIDVRLAMAMLQEDLQETEDKCTEFRDKYAAYSYLWTTDINEMFAEFLEQATVTLAAGTKVPDLVKFNEAITKYRALEAEIEGFKTPTHIGWLQVDSEPIKGAMITTVTKWTYAFTSYLQNFVVENLAELHVFMTNVETGLKVPVAEGDDDTGPLKEVMGHIRDVKKYSDQKKELFQPLQDIVKSLKKFSITLDSFKVNDEDVLDYLENAPMLWHSAEDHTLKKKEEIFPMQTAETDHTKAVVREFYESMREFRGEFRKKAPSTFLGPVDEAYAQIDDYEKRLIGIETVAVDMNELEELFELPISKYVELPETRSELNMLKMLWDFRALVENTFESWKATVWKEIDTESLEGDNRKFAQTIKKMGDTAQTMKGWVTFRDVESTVKNMAVTLPLINDLHSPAMRDRHWKALAQVCNKKAINPDDPKFCMEDLLALELHVHQDDVGDIVETATKELKIEKKMNAIEATWRELVLDYVPHKDSDVVVPKASDEVVEALEEHQMELQTIIGMGKFVDYFRDRVTLWQKNLGNVESVLKEWMSVTKAWASLESIFLGSADIRAQLPDDTKRFEGIDQEFKDLMKTAQETPNVVEVCTAEGREESLKGMTKNLELCQKSLNEYLDMKKKIFPRFYFVSTVALLDILSNGNNPPKIMQYIGDCYDSINDLAFQEAASADAVPNVTVSMTAKDGEKIDFQTPFVITGAVENWLNELTVKQNDTLRFILENAVETAVNWEVEKPRHLWLNDFPAQIVITCTQIFWTEETQTALEELEGGMEDAVKKYLGVCNERLDKLIERVLGKLSKELRIKIISLITLDVHGRDVVQKLIDIKAEGPYDFEWAKQLRFYWKGETRDAQILITDYKSIYFYEWVGNKGRLVITPLTDRCYITLTLAMRLMLGGAPAGPAGTGKTETVKDLAKSLAVPCYVFNCSPQMNYQSMADIFKGLCQTGAWGCFDEFNRISIEVLSVVATQVKMAQDAVVLYSVPANREEKYQHLPAGTPPTVVGTFELMGDPITIVPTAGFFITMNPGYAGRTELPENLKALFRSCAMIRPDLALICENMLMSEGFSNARPLSIKFTTLYGLSSELLSPQHHYDWGLRAVKSVLRVAGALKRAEPEVEEAAVLLRALRDFNTPKMPIFDQPIFLRLIQDLFPHHYQIATKFDEAVQKRTVEACKQNKLQYDHGFVAKVVQLQELLDVRHSVFVLGPAGSAKTTVWKMLAAGHNLGESKPTHIYEIVNPKSVDVNELYGYMTLAKDWKDGCLSIIMRGMSKNYKELGYTAHQSSKWVVLDGDIDTLWIESMNTVMDDNKVLTLVSNERIPLSNAMRMLFEINSLENASPATVSRAGILFINEVDVGWRPMVESWLNARHNEFESAQLPPLFDKYIDAIQESMRRDFSTVTPIRVISHIATVLSLLEALLPDPATSPSAEVIENFFIIAVMWAFGGSLIVDKLGDHRKAFHELLLSIAGGTRFPKEETPTLCFDYFYDPKGTPPEDSVVGEGEFVHWSTRVGKYEPVPIGGGPGETQFNNITVQTVDSVRQMWLLDQMIKRSRPTMFVGTAGTGKTNLVRAYLAQQDSEKIVSATINMNYYMDSKALQTQLESYIDKRSGRIFGPPTGKRLIFYVDDVNLPYIETYGTQNALELLRQIMDHGSCFDRVDLDLRKDIVDTIVVSSMNPTAGSFSITERLQWHFATFATLMPGASDLLLIYKSVLDGHLENFSEDVKALSEVMTNITIDLHADVAQRFLPSATKFVYNWNMRELTNIFQGLTLSRTTYFQKPIQMVRLWIHEVERVFGDRLVSEDDIKKYAAMVEEYAKKGFSEALAGENFENVVERPIIFTNFAFQPQGVDPTYLPVPAGADGAEKLTETLVDRLEDYNSQFSIMDLVLFQQAVEHVCRIARIIINPSGNAMLVGVGGSGKQSLSRLAAFICNYEVKQLAVTSRFTVLDLAENLKEMFKLAGVKGTGMVFLLTDMQIINDRFLVYINDMLTSGWISDLFEKDEMEGLFSPLRSEAKQAGIPDTADTMMEFLLSRVRNNLHIVLCFSPVGDTFRVRARRFPGLITCTAIDWFHSWPRDALVSVGGRFIEEVELGTPELKASIAEHMAEVHTTVTDISRRYATVQRRHNYTTPKSFLELIAFYKHLLSQKRDYVGKLIERLDVGLSTLRKTAADVAELQVDLEHTMVKVNEKREATDVLLKQMGVQRAEAEKQQEIANVEATAANAASEKAAIIENEAARELAEAEPAMLAARAAVDCLNKASLTELKSFPKPPAGVDKVTSCCLMMIDNEFKNHSWDRAKKMMAKVDAFIVDLKEYNAENMSDQLVERLEPFQQDPEFSQEAMMSKSAAAANLCAWVVNIYKYNRIWVKVKPLMDAKEEASQNKAAAQAKLAAAEAVVAEVEANLKALQDKLVEATTEKQAVEDLAEKCNIKLGLATRLVNGLASENERWGSEIEVLKHNEHTLIGDVLVAASFVSYIGAFDHTYRNELWRDIWMKDLVERAIPLTEGVDVLNMLTDDGKTAHMLADGLPADRISIENGSIISASKRWPLIIDPQLQGIKWLRKKAENTEGQQFMALQLTQPNWARHVVNGVSQGHIIIIENLGEDIDATLDPVLARAVYKRGRSMYLRIGGDEVEYDPKFRLFLQTKLTNPHYKPEIQAQCMLVNFIATEKGLEDQLLARVVNEERAELEQQKTELTEAFNQYKIQLMDLENQLLERLANAPEDILSDVPLIEGLEATKKAAVEIAEAVEKGQETEIAINIARNEYIPVAQEGAMLYFMITALDNVEHMYQYSLDAFMLYFYKAIRETPAEKETAKRVLGLRETLRITIYRWVSRGLFEAHKLTLAAQLTFSLQRRHVLASDEEFDLNLFNFLIRGPKKPGEANPLEWLPVPAWNAVQALATIDEFAKLPADMNEAPQRFREWFTHVTPEQEKLPLDWSSLDKTPMKKLLVLRCLRPDRLTVALADYVRTTLPNGPMFTECDSTLSAVQVLEDTLRDSVPATPIFFILSPGTDVVGDLDKIALSKGFVKMQNYHNVAMGQGQDVVAMDKLEMGHKQGHWVILNNVHLMPRWCVELEKRLDSFNLEGSHEKFRVFLTAEPSTGIPIGLLNRSIKLTNEPPTGLKANLKRAWSSFTKEQVEEADTKIRSIIFGLCHFHAIMIERKKFGSRGFNMMYPFSLQDLNASVVCLNNYMENASSKIPWEDLRYIFGQIMYGGHIVNDFDRLLCMTYLEFYMRDELLDEMELFPFAQDEKASFKTPSPTTYERYLEHIDKEFKGDTPIAFGLHPNAEIGFRTDQAEAMFMTIMDLQPKEAAAGEEGQSPTEIARNSMNEIMDRYGEPKFDLLELNSVIEEIRGPFQNVFYLECEGMHTLLKEISRSLVELGLGFDGELTMSESMENLMNALYLDRVPVSWGKLAWPSMRPLASWLVNLNQRVEQLLGWVNNPIDIPSVTWLSGMINPTSFLTAIRQQTAQRQMLELDKLVIQTDVTKKMAAEQEAASRDGAYVHGLFLQGARWDAQAASVDKSKPREMYVVMPVINCRAVLADKLEEKGTYSCPVYKTEMRGPTYVFSAQLKSKSPSARWLFAGVALILDLVL